MMNPMNPENIAAMMLALDPEHFDRGVDALARAVEANVKVLLFSMCYDKDQREIWEIPEARNLFLNTIGAVTIATGAKALHNSLMPETITLLLACRENHAQ
jgi:hypothetical protein